MWHEYFKLKNIAPGKVVTPKFGTLDFSKDNIPVETCKALFDSDFPYLELTEEGKSALYEIKPKTKKHSSKKKP